MGGEGGGVGLSSWLQRRVGVLGKVSTSPHRAEAADRQTQDGACVWAAARCLPLPESMAAVIHSTCVTHATGAIIAELMSSGSHCGFAAGRCRGNEASRDGLWPAEVQVQLHKRCVWSNLPNPHERPSPHLGT